MAKYYIRILNIKFKKQALLKIEITATFRNAGEGDSKTDRTTDGPYNNRLLFLKSPYFKDMKKIKLGIS